MTFRIVDQNGTVLGIGKDLDALREQLAPTHRRAVQRSAAPMERDNVDDWDFGTLPASVTLGSGASAAEGYPALVPEGDHVALRVLTSAAQAQSRTRDGVRRLVRRRLTPSSSKVLRQLGTAERVHLTQTTHSSSDALFEDCVSAAIDAVLMPRPVPRTRDEFDAAFAAVRDNYEAALVRVVRDVAVALRERAAVLAALEDIRHDLFATTRADIETQLAFLFAGDFVARHGAARIRDLGRYATGIVVRIARVKAHRDQDASATEILTEVLAEWDGFAASFPPGDPLPPAAVDIRYMIEEFRLNLFAQSVPTAYPISEKRIYRAMDAID